MPTYQYQCADCGETLEMHQSFSDDSLTECPACGGNLRKVFNAVGVVFKGSGFYRTDSRGKESSGDSSTSTPAASSTTAPNSTKTDSRPASKPAPSTSTTSSSDN